MMDRSGPIEHCCCDEMASQKNAGDDQDGHSPCCDFSSELTLKGVDLEGEAPVVLQSNSTIELPQAPLIFLLASLWPKIANPPLPPEVWGLDADPGSPGTGTYLSTLRLRI
jgi:hypothetical protein